MLINLYFNYGDEETLKINNKKKGKKFLLNKCINEKSSLAAAETVGNNSAKRFGFSLAQLPFNEFLISAKFNEPNWINSEFDVE